MLAVEIKTGQLTVEAVQESHALHTTDDHVTCTVPVLLPAVLRIRDSGSGAFLTPGSRIRKRFFPDPGSRISDPKPIFLELSDNFLGKKFYNSLKIGLFFSAFQNQIFFNIVKFVTAKKV